MAVEKANKPKQAGGQSTEHGGRMGMSKKNGDGQNTDPQSMDFRNGLL